jgi:ribonuclease VapC
VTSARLKRDAWPVLRALMTELDISVVPFGDNHARTAVVAWMRFGKGRHPAALNFGDCISYAVSKLAKMPLLCIGTDFRRTDLDLA